MNTFYNLLNTYFIKIVAYFYNFNKFKPLSPANKHIENYKNSNKFNKLNLIYTNPLWSEKNNHLVWMSFDQELELAKKRHYFYSTYYMKYPFYNKKYSTVIFQNPRWNYKTNKLEWNFIYK
jgi:hypothetical protein